MPPQPPFSGTAANPRTATAVGWSSRHPPCHRGTTVASPSCSPCGGRCNRAAHLLPPCHATRAVHHKVHSGAISKEIWFSITIIAVCASLPHARMAPLPASTVNTAPVARRWQDSRRPIFHTLLLSRMYSSKGWFMKLLKESRRNVLDDTTKAHLFYLPYRSQQLRLTLYVPESHNLRPWSQENHVIWRHRLQPSSSSCSISIKGRNEVVILFKLLPCWCFCIAQRDNTDISTSFTGLEANAYIRAKSRKVCSLSIVCTQYRHLLTQSRAAVSARPRHAQTTRRRPVHSPTLLPAAPPVPAAAAPKMPHPAASPPPPLPHKLLSRRRVVLACAAIAALALLLAAQTTEEPSRRRAYLVGSILGNTREYTEADASAVSVNSFSPSPADAPLPSPLETDLSSRTVPASSVFLAPSPSPAENFDDGSMEEPEHHEIKPISSGLLARDSDFGGETDMNDKSVLRDRPEQAPLWSTAADEELIYAKKEIANAPLVTDDPDLYAPLFRNVSIFKRSYEMMERLLKDRCMVEFDQYFFNIGEERMQI
ncbi:hypothetical protein PR202_gb26701 [Eleusine coracana subsp. coracana]|uniref:Uncharacterized protein n=1 Tax=Eleusine coracana subsp. coracana TaxID=191504 RepID=A0AAV5FTB8_ELECO|nr:hypothetical protein PR202_gb26701 [Eleusine coracana subsp. coracana]